MANKLLINYVLEYLLFTGDCPDPEIRRAPGLKTFFSPLRASVCGLKLGGVGPPLDPPPLFH